MHATQQLKILDSIIELEQFCISRNITCDMETCEFFIAEKICLNWEIIY